MKTIEAFKEYVSSVEAKDNYSRPVAFGIGVRKRKGDTTLEVFFPFINYEGSYGTAAVLQDVLGYDGNSNGYATASQVQINDALYKFEAFKGDGKVHQNIELLESLSAGLEALHTASYHTIDVIAYFLFDKDQPVATAEEGYFKTQCLSQLHVKPHEINVNGIFGKMNNVAWTNKGPIIPEDIAKERIKWTFIGEELIVSHVDKFPYMVNFHVPHGVRIVSGSQVRLGAYLSPGTTVMPAGYINFNAGTLGNAMVEGRISGGVVVGKDSDLGGGASIMGTLSGGNKNVISIGEKCLLGANAGTGISLGDGCTIAAGVYVTAAAKVSLYNKDKQAINLEGNIVAEGENIVKGHELDGRPYLLYLLDSQTGKLIVRPNSKVIELNESLHV
ncbi:MAG: 2,3,4,5-tetrahydropyridine-2-carboxylate N-succinyltransferase [Saprospiraceae bacterium]|jgi:2,3,4,5-tetrahydropyridine-2-carboxylate N-succinyltransferase